MRTGGRVQSRPLFFCAYALGMITRTTEPLDLISLHEAAEEIKVSFPTIKRFVLDHNLPAYRLPNSEFRVSRSELREWLRAFYVPAEVSHA